jgi:hypothetical protein
MTEDGRLELDEDGQLVDGATAVDLTDPDAVEDLATSRIQPWIDDTVAPWVRGHRRALVAVGLAAAVVIAGSAWWGSRPPYVAPTVALELDNAILDGNDLGGPEIAEGRISVAYTARALTAGDQVEVLGLSGPGIVPEFAVTPVTTAERARIQLSAEIDCRDPGLTTATPAAYGLHVRRTDATGDVLETTVPFGSATTELDLAVLSHCVSELAPRGLGIRSARVEIQGGSSIAALELLVENTAPLPLTVATQRRPTNGVEVDLSPTITIASGESEIVTTRLLVHDCLGTPELTAVSRLPNPVPGAGETSPGITLQVGLGAATTLASYPLQGGDVGAALERGTCAGRPEITTRLSAAQGTRSADGSWLVTGLYEIRTGGVRVRVGREHFAGPAVGEGSILATTDRLVPGAIWAIAPTTLDGGAGRVPVSFSGYSCTDLATTTPTTLAIGVTMADRSVYSFEVPVDDVRLLEAAYSACRLTPTSPLSARGWRNPATS